MDTAASRVLATYELLESILLRIPARKVFECQRVSKTWQGVIGRSHALRKKMFLLSDGDYAVAEQCQDMYKDVLYLCPLLRICCGMRQHLNQGKSCAIISHYTSKTMAEMVYNGLYLDRNTIESMSQPTRQMLLTQPPITVAVVHPALSGIPARSCIVQNQHGVTLDDFLDAATRIQADCTGFDVDFESQHASGGSEFQRHRADDQHDELCSSCVHIRAIRDE